MRGQPLSTQDDVAAALAVEQGTRSTRCAARTPTRTLRHVGSGSTGSPQVTIDDGADC